MKKTSIVLIILLILIFCFGNYIPLNLKSTLYSIGLTIQELLIFAIPFIIVIFISRSIILLKKHAFKFAFSFILLIYLSNFIASFISFNISFYAFANTPDLGSAYSNQLETLGSLKPLWTPNFYKILSNKFALIIGVILGILLPLIIKDRAEQIADKLFDYIMKFINSVFIPIIPIFILGFIIKLQHDNIFELAIISHLYILKIIIVVSLGYILLIYTIAKRFNIVDSFTSIINMLPAIFVAFVSMSSTAALPYTIKGVQKNIGQKSKILVSLIPATSNMHLLGDCFLVPACIIIVLKMFHYDITYVEFTIFLVYCVFMKFTVLTIPGGGILAILPLLSTELGFNSAMLSAIATLYFLLDPFLALLNVAGNGGFFIVLDKMLSAVGAKRATTTNIQ
jgi:Na+/H+-dicarboxylate symporter